jgi:hypothetical protein
VSPQFFRIFGLILLLPLLAVALLVHAETGCRRGEASRAGRQYVIVRAYNADLLNRMFRITDCQYLLSEAICCV